MIYTTHNMIKFKIYNIETSMTNELRVNFYSKEIKGSTPDKIGYSFILIYFRNLKVVIVYWFSISFEN